RLAHGEQIAVAIAAALEEAERVARDLDELQDRRESRAGRERVRGLHAWLPLGGLRGRAGVRREAVEQRLEAEAERGGARARAGLAEHVADGEDADGADGVLGVGGEEAGL